MVTYILRTLGIAFGLFLLGFPPLAFPREVRVASFLFEIPDSWIVEGNGGDRLFATGAAAEKIYSPPFLMADACVPTVKRPCSSLSRPDPAKELPEYGCTGVVARQVERRDQIVETQWVCAPILVSGTKTTAGFRLFEIDGSVLYISYVAGEHDKSVSVFLESLAHSLKVKK
jgi:hypothetical protein